MLIHAQLASVKQISIHALREEGDRFAQYTITRLTHFYPRPPRGGRPAKMGDTSNILDISIHALREEGDHNFNSPCNRRNVFLSTPSARRATVAVRRVSGLNRNFYPRPPRGGRHCSQSRRCSPAQFLSTPSARRATVEGEKEYRQQMHFYPRPPRGGRRPVRIRNLRNVEISIHALREEGDQSLYSCFLLGRIFLSTPSARRATRRAGRYRCICHISIHALREEGD